MQLAEDQLHAGRPFLRVDVHRHAATVVDHLEGTDPRADHLPGAGVTRQRLVDAVVDDLLAEVIGPGGVGVHAGAATHRFKAIEDLNGIRIVLRDMEGPLRIDVWGILLAGGGPGQMGALARVIQRGPGLPARDQAGSPGRSLHKLGEGAVKSPHQPRQSPATGSACSPSPWLMRSSSARVRPRVSCCTPPSVRNAFQAAQTAVPHQMEGRIPAAPKPELPDDVAAIGAAPRPSAAPRAGPLILTLAELAHRVIDPGFKPPSL